MGSIIALSPNGFQVVSYDTLSWVTVRFKRLYLLDPTLPVIKILNCIPYILSQSNGQETILKWRMSQVYSRRKCTFGHYILHFFHFGPYILFLPLLAPKPINVWHLNHYRQPTNGKNWGGKQNTLLADVALMWHWCGY